MNTLFLLLGMMFVCVCYGATTVGLGALFLSLVYRKTLLSFSCCFWIGLALLVTGLQIVNLFCGKRAQARSFCGWVGEKAVLSYFCVDELSLGELMTVIKTLNKPGLCLVFETLDAINFEATFSF